MKVAKGTSDVGEIPSEGAGERSGSSRRVTGAAVLGELCRRLERLRSVQIKGVFGLYPQAGSAAPHLLEGLGRAGSILGQWKFPCHGKGLE